jgi:5-methylcytosine-specific restriction endonuclease McrA
MLFKKGMSPWNKGLKTGPNPEHSERMKGRIPWNKGKHPDYLQGENHPMYGKHPTAWNKGKKGYHIHSEEFKNKLRARLTGKNNHAWKGGFCRTKEWHAKSFKEWRRRNPLSVKASYHKRRILLSDLTLQVIQQVYEDNIKQYGTLTCYLCLEPVPFGKDHLEHKTPLSRGGANDRKNLDVACQKCNCSKNNKTVEEYKTEVQNL